VLGGLWFWPQRKDRVSSGVRLPYRTSGDE
jgi:hypothetical protein